MSTSTSMVVRQQPAFSSKGWVCLRIPALTRLAALELLAESQTLEIPESTQEALKLISTANSKNSTNALKVWVDTDGLDWLVHTKDAEEHRRTALQYFIKRQAHYPLLKKLFNVTRNEATEQRKTLKAELPPTKPKNIANSDLDAIYAYWRELREYEMEIDQWFLLALRFEQYPLSCLYSAIWIESPINTLKGTS